MNTRMVQTAVASVCLLGVFLTGCKKPAPPPPPPPPKAEVKEAPKPSAPVVGRLTAEPSTVTKGQAATLRWSVSGATDITIDNGVGSVQANDSRSVYPSSDTTYTLTARGVGGTTTASVSVRVVDPPKEVTREVPKAPKRTASEFIAQELKDAFFDYDKFDIRDDGRSVLTSNAQRLKDFFADGDYRGISIIIEGHCDERGSDAYNVALGDKRAAAAMQFLKDLGVPTDRLKTVSYGKERPQCSDSNEDCWQRNRRAHFGISN